MIKNVPYMFSDAAFKVLMITERVYFVRNRPEKHGALLELGEILMKKKGSLIHSSSMMHYYAEFLQRGQFTVKSEAEIGVGLL